MITAIIKSQDPPPGIYKYKIVEGGIWKVEHLMISEKEMKFRSFRDSSGQPVQLHPVFSRAENNGQYQVWNYKDMETQYSNLQKFCAERGMVVENPELFSRVKFEYPNPIDRCMISLNPLTGKELDGDLHELKQRIVSHLLGRFRVPPSPVSLSILGNGNCLDSIELSKLRRTSDSIYQQKTLQSSIDKTDTIDKIINPHIRRIAEAVLASGYQRIQLWVMSQSPWYHISKDKTFTSGINEHGLVRELMETLQYLELDMINIVYVPSEEILVYMYKGSERARYYYDLVKLYNQGEIHNV